ncbi:hypothetical protein [Anaerohalosphaera lusitana]|nr:hypothetical protein [Anaerohalosphaera lusitana]
MTKSKEKIVWHFILLMVLFSCSSCERQQPNVRQTLENDYLRNSNETDVKVVRFAHIGKIESKGKSYYVIDLRTVLKGMPAPRGNNQILLYDNNLTKVASFQYDSMPLWCKGSRVYLFGVDTQEGMFGNVWDFSKGVNEGERRLIELPAYGSYKSEQTLGSRL